MPPIVNRAQCNGCGICIYQCGMDVYGFDPKEYKVKVVNPAKCVECFICVSCPREAVKVSIRRSRYYV